MGLALAAVLPAAAQTTAVPAPATGDSSLTIFIRGVEVGRMQSTVSHPDTSWVISSTGRFGDIVLNRLEIKYDARLAADVPSRRSNRNSRSAWSC